MRSLITEHRLQNPDAFLGAGVGIRHVLQAILRADNPKVAPNLTIALTQEDLFADGDAIKARKLFVGYVDGNEGAGAHRHANPAERDLAVFDLHVAPRRFPRFTLIEVVVGWHVIFFNQFGFSPRQRLGQD